jgi:hypothetical protein
MGLFFDILSSINHPEQRGSIEQLATVLTQAQQLSDQHDLDASTLQSLVTGLGRAMQSGLQEPDRLGSDRMERLFQWVRSIDRPSSITAQPPLKPLWNDDQQRTIVREVAQKTGLPIQRVESMLPALVQLILGLLNMGTIQSVAKVTNPLLTRFRDDDSPLGDVLRLSNRFLAMA